jgi:hypothetical protein
MNEDMQGPWLIQKVAINPVDSVSEPGTTCERHFPDGAQLLVKEKAA